MKVVHNNREYNVAVVHKKNSQGDLIVFVHGLGSSKEIFQPVFTDKRFSQLSLLSFDLLGHGKSEKSKEFSYTLKDHAKILEILLSNYKFKNLYIISHSMGTAISLFLSKRIIKKVKLFISIEGTLVNHDTGIRLSFSEFKSNKSLSSPAMKSLTATDETAFTKTAESLARHLEKGKLLTKFQILQIPTYFVYGEKNKKYFNVLPKNSRVISIINSGHFPMLDNPKDFYHTLAKIMHA